MSRSEKNGEILVDRSRSTDFHWGIARGYSSSHCGVEGVKVTGVVGKIAVWRGVG